MASYTEPIAKQWVMDGYDDFKEGISEGAEIENPNYVDKIVLECKLGTNLLGPTEKNWNPSFEEEAPPPNEGTPRHWSFEFPSTRSTYEQESEEAYEGVDFVKLADEGEGGKGAWAVGKIILDPEEVSPNKLELGVDPAKYYTIRVHGRHENPEEIKYKSLDGLLWYDDDGQRTEADLTLLGRYPEEPPAWERADHRVPPGEATKREIQRLLFKFGAPSFGMTLPKQRWCVDGVSVAETFPAEAEFFAEGTYTSPTFATPSTLSKVVWGIFEG